MHAYLGPQCFYLVDHVADAVSAPSSRKLSSFWWSSGSFPKGMALRVPEPAFSSAKLTQRQPDEHKQRAATTSIGEPWVLHLLEE